ncbi:MAG: serine/threonine protein kinase [Vicinamibacteria bacterium]|nr:serine/threonine protein kinase [Vicinamibacteria bacterium]
MNPTRLGRYELGEKLGEGAMGLVFRARDTVLDRIVALKTLPFEGATDEIQERFRREAEAIGRMDHPHVVKVFDLGETEGRLFMAMELLDGEDLRRLVELSADIPITEKLRIFAEACDGFSYAHSRGVVHRDIKPANIMVTKLGITKVLDFGLARMETHQTLTRKGVILGTPDYMSPEQATGKAADPRSDVFSCGAVFFEFITGFKPFRGATLHAVLFNIVSEPTTPVVTLAPETPARVASLIHRMIAKNPTDRPSMDETSAQLRSLRTNLLRSRLKSCLRSDTPRPSREETAQALKAHLARAKAHLDADSPGRAIAEASEALFLDPDSRESTEVLWRGLRASPVGAFATSPASVPRVQELLGQLNKAKGEEALKILRSLYLHAPDDPSVREAIRQFAL